MAVAPSLQSRAHSNRTCISVTPQLSPTSISLAFSEHSHLYFSHSSTVSYLSFSHKSVVPHLCFTYIFSPVASLFQSLIINSALIDTALRKIPQEDITNIQQQASAAKDLHDTSIPDEEMEDGTIDGMLHALGMGGNEDHAEPSADTLGEMSMDFVAVLAASEKVNHDSILKSTTSSFISYYSTINQVSTSTLDLPRNAEVGNSRSAPTKLFHSRRKDGCPRYFPSILRRDQHEVNCKGQSLDDLPDEEALPVDDAGQLQPIPQGRKRKTADINVVHNGFPKRCPDNGAALRFDEKWPENQSCNVDGCQLPKDHYFVSREGFRRHLTSYHMLDATKAREYIGKVIDVAFTALRGAGKTFLATMCLFPDCKTKAEFANYSDYTSHLKKQHDQTPKDYPEYMPTAETIRRYPRPDISSIDITSLVPREFGRGRCGRPHRSDKT